jgi:hypothetical protein
MRPWKASEATEMGSKALTDALVRGARPPTSGRLEIADLRCPGLAIRITPSAVRSWSFRYRDAAGKTNRALIGHYPDVYLSEARAQAVELRRKIAKGIDPNEEKRRNRREAGSKLYGALLDRYLTDAEVRVRNGHLRS